MWFRIHIPRSVTSLSVSSSAWSWPVCWRYHVFWPLFRWSIGSRNVQFRVFICFWIRHVCQLSDGKVVCWSQRFGGQDLLCGVWFTSPERRGRSCWTHGYKPHQESLRQSAHIAGTPGPSRQPVGLNGCVRQQSVGIRRHRELLPLSCIDRSQRGKGQDDRKEERDYHDQPESRTDCRWRLKQRRAKRLPVRGATAIFMFSTPLRVDLALP